MLPQRQPVEPSSLGVSWEGAAVQGTAAWTGPASILVIVAAMYVFTATGFELLQSLPLAGAGGAGH
jgi:cytochrome c oxidase subunit I